MRVIAALNALNQPWVAIIVIVIGMTFDIICKRYGVSTDSATGVIGAGVGLLTGQGIHAAAQLAQIQQVQPPDPTKANSK